MATTKVTTGGITDATIATSDLANNAVVATKIATAAVTSDKIAAEAVDLTKLPHGTSSNDGKFLRANNGADPTFETVNTDLVSDTSPQLGGDLASNGNDIKLADTDKITAGTGDDLLIYHDGSHSYIYDTGMGKLRLVTNSFRLLETDNTASMIAADENGAVELYYDGGKKLETHAHGIRLNGSETGAQFQLGASNDFQIEHDGSNTYIYNLTNDLVIQNDAAVKITAKSGGTQRFRFDSDGLKFGTDTAVGNALDDYEEGTFTATCDNGVTLHSSQDLCQYTKIGRQVTVRGQIRVNNENGGNQNLIVNNLPFSTASGNEGSASSVGAVRIWDQNIPSNALDVVCETYGSTNTLNFWINRDNTGAERMKANTNAYALFTLTYFAS